jgi:hypothetical protein
VQAIGRRRCSGGGTLVRHVVDGGEEVRVRGERIRRWRWTAQISAPFRPPPALTDDGSGGGERRGGGGGASRRPRANPRSVGTVGVGSGCGELLGAAPRAPLLFFIALATGPANHNGLDAPDQGAPRGLAQSLDWAKRSIPTFSLLISHYSYSYFFI